jgi:hypothetical protein
MQHFSDILPILQALPVGEQEALIEILSVSVKEKKEQEEQEKKETKTVAPSEGEAEEPFQYDPSNPMWGLFYDEPEAMDELMRHIKEGREQWQWRKFDE